MNSPIFQTRHGAIYLGDALELLPQFPAKYFQVIVADPPYFQVLTDEEWDNRWKSEDDYLEWTLRWARECRRVLSKHGLMFVFGQLGKREHVWLHACSQLAQELPFHDMLIWDRAVGYNDRRDSFTPQYEMILVLRGDQDALPYFDKDAVRIPYDDATIRTYLQDKRYKDREARLEHLQRGKFATNILRVPSLKGRSKEKVGHPSQKPAALIEKLLLASSRPGDPVLDPFLGSGTTAACAESLGRTWTGIEQREDYARMAARRIEKDAPDLLFK